MAKATGASYKAAGVDIDSGNRFVKDIRRLQKNTFGPRVAHLPNGFAGLFSLDYDTKLFAKNYKHPILVACTDGIGTKLAVAFQVGQMDTVGIDLVAMSVNDLVVVGAEPLFFLDYIATSKLDGKQLLELMGGIAEGCRQSGCALLGGETAEMPGFYKPGELDAAGFAVGVVEKKRVIDGRTIEAGDVILGIASDGLHSNGFSLVRHVLLEKKKHRLNARVDDFGCTLGEELLKPTAIYVEAIRRLLGSYKIKRIVGGLAHITGGGLVENVPRVLPPNTHAVLHTKRWAVPPIFDFVQKEGKIARSEMFRVFNMGIGMVVICPEFNADAVMRKLRRSGRWCGPIGVVARGKKKTQLK